MSDADYVLWFGILPSVLTLAYLWRRRSYRGHGEGVKPSSPKPRPGEPVGAPPQSLGGGKKPVLIVLVQREPEAPKPRRRAF